MTNEFKQKWKKKICIGVTKDKELVYIEIQNRSCDNNHYTITHSTYGDIIEESKGEEEAKERLSDRDYYDELGYLQKDCFLNDFIDFEEVADHIINVDGWEMINGEYSYFGEYEENDYYINYSSCGASIDDLKKKYSLLLITEEEKQILIDSDRLHLKDFSTYTKKDKELYKKVLEIKNKYENQEINEQKIIKEMLEE